MSKKNCPICKTKNDDDWPVKVNGTVKWGGCQRCWEAECDDEWFIAGEAVEAAWFSLNKKEAM